MILILRELNFVRYKSLKIAPQISKEKANKKPLLFTVYKKVPSLIQVVNSKFVDALFNSRHKKSIFRHSKGLLLCLCVYTVYHIIIEVETLKSPVIKGSQERRKRGIFE